jgi:hypothetical protein
VYDDDVVHRWVVREPSIALRIEASKPHKRLRCSNLEDRIRQSAGARRIPACIGLAFVVVRAQVGCVQRREQEPSMIRNRSSDSIMNQLDCDAMPKRRNFHDPNLSFGMIHEKLHPESGSWIAVDNSIKSSEKFLAGVLQ